MPAYRVSTYLQYPSIYLSLLTFPSSSTQLDSTQLNSPRLNSNQTDSTELTFQNQFIHDALPTISNPRRLPHSSIHPAIQPSSHYSAIQPSSHPSFPNRRGKKSQPVCNHERDSCSSDIVLYHHINHHSGRNIGLAGRFDNDVQHFFPFPSSNSRSFALPPVSPFPLSPFPFSLFTSFPRSP